VQPFWNFAQRAVNKALAEIEHVGIVVYAYRNRTDFSGLTNMGMSRLLQHSSNC
jgi:hypothetical protein